MLRGLILSREEKRREEKRREEKRREEKRREEKRREEKRREEKRREEKRCKLDVGVSISREVEEPLSDLISPEYEYFLYRYRIINDY